jgi:hypothetical protein
MWFKMDEDGVPQHAPINIVLDDGTTILNFDTVANEHGYKELTVDMQPLFDPAFQQLVPKYVEEDSVIVQKWEVHDVLTLDEFRQQRIDMFNTMCNKEILGGFMSQGYQFIFDYEAQDNFSQEILSLLLDPSITEVEWKTEDQGVVTLTKEQFLLVVQDAKTHKLTTLRRYWDVKDRILNAGSVPEVLEQNW